MHSTGCGKETFCPQTRGWGWGKVPLQGLPRQGEWDRRVAKGKVDLGQGVADWDLGLTKGKILYFHLLSSQGREAA